MTLTMKSNTDLFTFENTHLLAHCVSSDFALGAGIAKAFTLKQNMSQKLKQAYPGNKNRVGEALIVNNTANLVTKLNYWHKPTYKTLRLALQSLRRQCVLRDITDVAMPLIGCGLDRLEWSQVEKVIKEVFDDSGINIVICTL